MDAGVGGSRSVRVAVIACALVAMAGAMTGVAPSATAGPAIRTDRCFAVDVRGLDVASARLTLRGVGCRPGRAQDGRHYTIRYMCRAPDQSGTVVAQRPVNRLLGPRQVLVLQVGSPAASPQCQDSLKSSFDGDYSATALITASSAPDLPQGSTVDGLSFTVSQGVMSGVVVGHIDATGRSLDAVATVGTRQCTAVGPGLQFTRLASGSVVFSGDMACATAPAILANVGGLSRSGVPASAS
jgi:hypothetical protein